MPGFLFHHSVAVLPLPFRRSVVPFRCTVAVVPFRRLVATVAVARENGIGGNRFAVAVSALQSPAHKS